MGIPEEQFDTWSHQGAIAAAKQTADSVKNALDSYDDWPDGIEYEIYLQGSYKNDTNIYGDMDVDIIVQLNSTFYSNLSDDQKRILGITSADYGWSDFRKDTLNALENYYNSSTVSEGDKTLKIKADNGRLPADVVVCAQYRQYNSVSSYDYVEGIIFWTKNEGRRVINYPKVHYRNGVNKHQATGDWYKPTVRIFKNTGKYLVDQGVINEDTAPSYFVECLIYNVPREKFGESYRDTFCNAVNWLNETDFTSFVCQNGILDLFGTTPEQWSETSARTFINACIDLWNNWS